MGLDMKNNSGSVFHDPFAGLDAPAIYELLSDPSRSSPEMPKWPAENVQRKFTGTAGVDLVRRALSFISMLESDGAFKEGWKGLDYGCGWGRFASLLRSKGRADQLDLVDAWPSSLEELAAVNGENKRWLVSEMLGDKEISKNTYNFILSFSVFTHLSPRAFEHNLMMLCKALKKRGTFYFTVRHEEFLDHAAKSKLLTDDDVAEARKALPSHKIWFKPTQVNTKEDPVFGNSVVTTDYLESLARKAGELRYLGKPHDLQHVYGLTRI